MTTALLTAPPVRQPFRPAGKWVIDPTTGRFEKLLAITGTSKRGRDYPDPVLDEIVALIPGVPINANHIQPGDRRLLQDRIGGADRGWREGHKVWFSGWFNPAHALFQQILYDANNHPRNLGFSIDSRGTSTTVNGRVIIEHIDRLLSIDLVANPAATNGLLESRDGLEGFSPLPPEIRKALRGRQGNSDMFTQARLAHVVTRFTAPESRFAEREPEPIVEDHCPDLDPTLIFVPSADAPLASKLRRFVRHSV